MQEHDPQRLLGQAERLVAKAMSAGADQAEVWWTRSVELELVLENNAVQGGGRSRTEGAALRLIKDGRLGFAYLTDIKDADKTIDRALRLSKLAPKKSLELPAGQPASKISSQWDDATAHLDVQASLATGRRLLDAVADEDGIQLAGGGVDMGWGLEAIANSEGVAACHRATATSIGANLVTQDDRGAMNLWDDAVAHIGTPDPEALMQGALDDIRSLRDPAPSSSGVADVVFRPSAASELVTNLVGTAVDGDDAMRGKTVWSDRLGDAVAAPGLQIIDDPLREGAIGAMPFDGDGLPTLRTPIIEAGVLKTFLFDSRDGAEHGKPSTHHASRNSFKSPPGVDAHHLIIEGDRMEPEAKLIAGIDNGYLVESVLGAHTANATTGDFSITAPNVWRVKGGEVVGAAQEIAIAGNLPELLMRVDGIGDTPRRMDGAWVPMLRFRDVQISV